MSRGASLAFALAACIMMACHSSSGAGPDAGEWKISNAAAEVVAAAAPARILSYSGHGQPNLLFRDPAHARSGIRFIALEEKEGRLVSYALEEQGEWLDRQSDRVTLKASAKEGEATLQLDAILEPAGNRLLIQCRLENNAAATRTLALWAIASVPPSGLLVMTNSRGFENNRWVHGRFVSFWSSPLNSPALQWGIDALGLDPSKPLGGSSIKYGTRSNAGWIAVARPDLQTLWTGSVHYSQADKYPDEDCNVEIWAGKTPEELPYAEIEWLSPWKTLDTNVQFAWDLSLASKPLDVNEPAAESIVQLVRSPALVGAVTAADSQAAHRSRWTIDPGAPMIRDSLNRVTKIYGKEDSKGETPIAVAPLWFNAPIWSENGPSLRFGPDTLLEPNVSQFPRWTNAPRRWTVVFSSSKSPDVSNQVLLQDGNDKAALTIYLTETTAEALLWHRAAGEAEPAVSRLSVPIVQDKVHTLKVSVDREAKMFEMKIDDAPAQKAAINFEMPVPAKRLGIGRNAHWPEGLRPDRTGTFRGAIYKIELID